MLVLVGEDDPTIRRTLDEFFEILGHRTLLAQDVQEALMLARSHAVDLLVTGIQMPWLDGAALVQVLGSELPALPVVVMTGYADPARLAAIRRSGCRLLRIRQKPFRLEELAEAAANVSER